jgi:hypothetical protein
MWTEVDASVQILNSSIHASERTDGIGDMTILPAMFAWECNYVSGPNCMSTRGRESIFCARVFQPFMGPSLATCPDRPVFHPLWFGARLGPYFGADRQAPEGSGSLVGDIARLNSA